MLHSVKLCGADRYSYYLTTLCFSHFPAKLARLSLALPPLALTLPLTPTGKGGFGDGAIGNRIGRRRGLSPGSDPDDEEEDEQEDESSRRVIVVTETDVDKRVGLRSLLKSPKEPMDREKDRGRNVSFFDDVTIYLFDQVLSLRFYKFFMTDCVTVIRESLTLWFYCCRKLQPMN